MRALRLFMFLSFLLFLHRQTIHAQWQQLNGPIGELVYALVVSPNGTSGTNLFAGTYYGVSETYYGSVFLYTDNDTTWTEVNSGLTNTHVTSLAISPASGGSGTNLFSGTDRGVFLSTNNGTSWTQINSGLTDTSVQSLAFSGANLFAGTVSNGVFLSTNNGIGWIKVNSGLTNTYVTSLAVSPATDRSDTNIFAGTWGGGIFLTTDNGTSWTEVNSGLANTFIRFLTVSGTNLFAGTMSGLFLSTNKDTKWTVLGLPQNYFIDALAVSGTKIFIGGLGGIFLSINDGASWTEVNSGLPDDVVNSLAVSNTTLFAGTQLYGVWRRPLEEMITSVQQVPNETPKQFILADNYPNPFNPSTTIQFSLPKSTYVTLKIYNALGQEVAQLVSENMITGTYTIKWNASSFANGVYFCRVEAGGFVQTKKLVLLK